MKLISNPYHAGKQTVANAYFKQGAQAQLDADRASISVETIEKLLAKADEDWMAAYAAEGHPHQIESLFFWQADAIHAMLTEAQ